MQMKDDDCLANLVDEVGHLDAENSNLIVNYLPYEFNEGNLQNLFGKFGEITEAKVVRDRFTKKSVGYGFVKFRLAASAAEAIKELDRFTIGQKTLKVSLARPPSDEIKNCKLFISNISSDISEEALKELFSQYGEIIECRLVHRQSEAVPVTHVTPDSSKTVAFIQFHSRSQAAKALELDGYIFPGTSKSLSVQFTDNHRKNKKSPRSALELRPYPSGSYSAPVTPRDEIQGGIMYTQVAEPMLFQPPMMQTSPFYADQMPVLSPYGHPFSSQSWTPVAPTPIYHPPKVPTLMISSMVYPPIQDIRYRDETLERYRSFSYAAPPDTLGFSEHGDNFRSSRRSRNPRYIP